MSAIGTDGRIAEEEAPRLHKPGVAGSSPAAANSDDSVLIDHEPAEVHHSRPGISASQLKALALSPAEFYHRYVAGDIPPYESAAMAFGTLLHLWAELGEERFWDTARRYPAEVLTATGLLGKAAKEFAASQPAGTILVTPSDWRKLYDQTRQILANKAAARLLANSIDKEFNVQWRWNGHACRCRCDGATEEVWYDLKTTSEQDPKRSAWRAVQKFFYDIQAAFYGEAAVRAGWKPHAMRFIFTSTVPPHLCCVVWLPQPLMDLGRTRCIRLMDEIANRREWNQWLPDDYGEEFELRCPEFMFRGEEF